jgi:Xaa-Pro aminopeptidase
LNDSRSDASVRAATGRELADPMDDEALRRMRAYRLDRVRQQLEANGFGAAVLFDPCNIRYATGSRNMAVWTLHNHVRCAFVPAQGLPVVFEFGAGRWPVETEQLESVGEVRPAGGWTHFYAGSRKVERAMKWADEIAALVEQYCAGEHRIAIDHVNPVGVEALNARQLAVVDAEGLLERARLIKSADEMTCIRHSIAVAELGMARMRKSLRPGLSENELWSILHQTNIVHGGEWIETRLLSSGPRTNPWMQECGHRAIEAGDLVAFDTDMIGPHGYCADISRTFFCGAGEPTREQRRLYRASFEQLQHNLGIFRPGRTLREVVEDEWPIPAEFLPYRYGLAHGVGLKDEYPFLPNRKDLGQLSDPDQRIEPGMVFSLESYIGAVGGGEGVKLEDQLLITEEGAELLCRFPFENALLA